MNWLYQSPYLLDQETKGKAIQAGPLCQTPACHTCFSSVNYFISSSPFIIADLEGTVSWHQSSLRMLFGLPGCRFLPSLRLNVHFRLPQEWPQPPVLPLVAIAVCHCDITHVPANCWMGGRIPEGKSKFSDMVHVFLCYDWMCVWVSACACVWLPIAGRHRDSSTSDDEFLNNCSTL